MKEIRFSIVTPTYNRAPILRRMLAHLRTVRGIEGCEVIVIDDGSTDDTPQVLRSFSESNPGMLKVVTLENGGPARARNAGVQCAQHERILFIDDDVFPRQNMLEQHWLKLDAGFDGSQGLLLWHEEILLTPLIDYIDSRGSQFAFDQIADDDRLSGRHIYTGNFATYRKLILDAGGFCENLFDRQLAFSAFEDTVLGYALQEMGARLTLCREAVADHLHHMTESGFLKREYNVGSGVAQLQRQFPAISRDLGLDGKGRHLAIQIALLQAINALPVERLAGYRVCMRLRHRESFLRGFQRYERAYPRGRVRPKA